MTQGSETTDRTAALERRGLIAAGAALVTAALAKVMAKPAAAGHPGSDPTILHLDVQNISNALTKIGGTIPNPQNPDGPPISLTPSFEIETAVVDRSALTAINKKSGAAAFEGGGGAATLSVFAHPNALAVWAATTGQNNAFFGYSNGTAIIAHGGPQGVLGDARAFGGVGVYGDAKEGSGLYGVGGWNGVYGSGVKAGVYGFSSTGDAGKFVGNVNVIGTLTKSGGGFKIDHPLDPANKFLSHSFVESPEMKTVYDGVAVLGETGRAVVDLPEWFEALNREFRYQLTPIGSPAPDLHVAEEIANNRFQIAGGPPGVRVSWQVTGTRRDAYAEHHRVPVEEVKSAGERGKYLHPLEHSQPERLGIFYGDIEWAERLQMEVSKSNEQLKEREAELLKQHEEQQPR